MIKSTSKPILQIFSLILTLVTVISALPFAALPASAAAAGDYEYEVLSEADKACKIVKYNGSLTKIEIPSQLAGYSVTEIGDFAFSGCADIIGVTVPDSVTKIGDGAFESCKALKSVVISGEISDVSDWLFYKCSSLASVTVPKSIKSIGNAAFADCNSLKSIEIPNGVESIGYFAFENCSLLSAVAIPDSVKSISGGAFNNCITLASITIPDTVTHIGGKAFDNTAYYKNEANWENGVLYIGKHLIRAEYNVPEYYEVKLGTKTMAVSAFYDCIYLKNIVIPDSVVSIAESTFAGCVSLDCVIIPDSVTGIGDSALYNCSSLLRVTVPDSVKYIGKQAFGYANSEKIPEFTISGYAETEAQRYAAENKFEFIELEKPTVILGDVNGDGRVTAIDVRWVLQYAAKKRNFTDKEFNAADMNGDGKITAIDARKVLKIAAGK